MSGAAEGRVSELLLVRMHGRAEAYVAADERARVAIVEACKREATVPELAARILGRTIYAQAATRAAPLRELVQNALDASPRGGRVDVRSSDDGSELTITDRGHGMSRAELLGDLLVPFRSAKSGDIDTIGEHGIGFFSVLELGPRIELTSVTAEEGSLLVIEPLGDAPPYPDFTFRVTPLPRTKAPSGTSIRVSLARPISRAALVAEIASVAGLVDPDALRIYVDDVLVNGARERLRRVARAGIAGGELGELELLIGTGAGLDPSITIVQAGLLVAARQDPFTSSDLALHRDVARAVASSGYALVVELPLSVPLNKGRSGVAGGAASAVDAAIVAAFERFVLEDALFDRELLRAIDHRVAAILDRLVLGALGGEPAPPPPEPDENAPTLRPSAPTVAAPEEVVRFASALIEARVFRVSAFDARLVESSQRVCLRDVLAAHRAGALRRLGEPVSAGLVYLDARDPIAEALLRRLASDVTPRVESVPPPAPRLAVEKPVPVQRISRAALLAVAGHVPGVAALSGALGSIERIDGAIAQASGLAPSPISMHQDLYGPDEMAHTDGTGISVNFGSRRVRALLAAILAHDDATAFGALVDLLIHEKTHVSLASYVPRPAAEHGTSFYRRKDLLRRQLLEALSRGAIIDPIRWLPSIRRTLTSLALPDPVVLAGVVTAARNAA